MRRFLLIAAAVLALLPSAYGQKSKSRTQSKLDAVKKEIAALDGRIKANESRSADALSRLTLTRKKIDAGKVLVSTISAELDSINAQIAEKQRDIADAERNLGEMKNTYEKIVRTAYLHRDKRSTFLLVLSGEDFSQMVRRAIYMSNASSKLQEQALTILHEKENLEISLNELDSLKKEGQALLNQRNTELNGLRSAEKKEQREINSLKSKRKSYEKQLRQKRREAESLNATLKKLVEQEMAAAKKSSAKSPASKGSKKTSANPALSNAFAKNKGVLPYPVDGTVVASFGEHYHPVYTKVKLPFNNGCNIATSAGSSVKAVYEGTVSNVVIIPGYNQCVLIQHGDYYTFYCKLSEVRVKAGDKVKQGTILGSVDNELHFQLWKGGDPQDPELWIK